MIFEHFYSWNEEKLGLIGGISFVLLGIFAYFIYLLHLPLGVLVLGFMVVVFSALTALFFQLPRIKGLRAGISTFIGGIMLGITIISWGYSLSLLLSESWALMMEAAALSIGLLIASFFGFGFLFIALIPPQQSPSKEISFKSHKPQPKKGVKEFKEDDDFIDRL